MKNEVNRALVAKKKNYNQPAVQVARIALESMVLAGSPAPAPSGDEVPIGSGDTDIQW